MKEIVLNEKNETAIHLIANVLHGYCDMIYNISANEPETAMSILLGKKHSEILYDVLIAHEVEMCGEDGKYKDISDIDLDDLKEEILYWNQEHIIALVLKNIKQDQNEDPIYWKLKMTVNRH
jgi:SHS2 domain-containing protein